ncbi:hypothetical protein HOP38_18660 [Vibrio mediterranei]|uniref:hypothetical protein n=1 Tax=Vibrio mediterranei TaxID=689 RepID=UPI0017BC9010|nr:hypothetical protein [Vibrio mediterranei]NUW74514.1 hypothetical protein [Vibrio mediterranei]
MKSGLISFLAFVPVLSQASTLCHQEENWLAGCELRNDKVVSFCTDKTGLTTYRYGKPNNIELTIKERQPGTMKTLSEGYSRGAASEYQAQNGRYTYTYTDGLYGSNDATYLLMELNHRGFEIAGLTENTLSHHTVDKSLTVSHDSKGELTNIKCDDDSHFYGEPVGRSEYIHILRNVTDEYRLPLADLPPQCQSDAASCVKLYEDFNRDFIFVQFQSIDQSSFVNDKAYLIKMATGDISQVTMQTLSSSDETLMKPLLYLTVDAKQLVVSLESEVR